MSNFESIPNIWIVADKELVTDKICHVMVVCVDRDKGKGLYACFLFIFIMWNYILFLFN